MLHEIISNLPSQINHLHILIKQVKHIEMIFEHCFHLNVITGIQQWFDENTIRSTYRRENQCNTICIGIIKQRNDLNHKPIKINHKDS